MHNFEETMRTYHIHSSYDHGAPLLPRWIRDLTATASTTVLNTTVEDIDTRLSHVI